jgi:ABC-type molybdate transport system substrate-binding protein
VTPSGGDGVAARAVWPRLAGRLVSFILSPEGPAILARHGFAAPTSPGG